jgi:hypothetical protein
MFSRDESEWRSNTPIGSYALAFPLRRRFDCMATVTRPVMAWLPGCIGIAAEEACVRLGADRPDRRSFMNGLNRS